MSGTPEISAKRSAATYLWRTGSANGFPWAAATRMVETIDDGNAERINIDMWEANGHEHDLAPEDKSDIALVPVCLTDSGDARGALVLCDTFLAAGGEPTKPTTRPRLIHRFENDAATMALGLQIGFTIVIDLDNEIQAKAMPVPNAVGNPTNSPLAKELLRNSSLGISSVRHPGNRRDRLEVVLALGNPIVVADHCELVLAILAGHAECKHAKVTEVWASTAATMGEGGAEYMLTHLNARSKGEGVAANSRSGRFYIPASVARAGKGHYIDTKPTGCVNSYDCVRNVADLWTMA